jgi:hypothetical protein
MNKQIDRQTVMVMMMIHVMHQQLQVTTEIEIAGDNSNVRWMQRFLDGNDSRTVEVLC